MRQGDHEPAGQRRCSTVIRIRIFRLSITGHIYRIFVRAVLELFTASNPHAFKVGEMFILEGMSNGNSEMIVEILQYWAVNKAIKASQVCPFR